MLFQLLLSIYDYLQIAYKTVLDENWVKFKSKTTQISHFAPTKSNAQLQ